VVAAGGKFKFNAAIEVVNNNKVSSYIAPTRDVMCTYTLWLNFFAQLNVLSDACDS
jgi:hypothetical protein